MLKRLNLERLRRKKGRVDVKDEMEYYNSQMERRDEILNAFVMENLKALPFVIE